MCVAYTRNEDCGLKKYDMSIVKLSDGCVESTVHGLQVLGISIGWNGRMEKWE